MEYRVVVVKLCRNLYFVTSDFVQNLSKSVSREIMQCQLF